MPIELEVQAEKGRWGVWQIDEPEDELIASYLPVGDQIDRIEDFGSEMRRRQWLAVRLLAQELTGQCTISYRSNGKPEVSEGFISISHSHEKVAVSYNPSADTGIDIQKMDPKILRISRRFLNDDEKAWVGQDLLKMTQCWCVKEAMYKLYGDCSPHFAQDFRVSPISDDVAVCEMRYHDNWQSYQLKVNSYQDYIVAVVND